MQDPWVQGSGWKKGAIAPQKCYLDNIEAWSVNECTINWNAPLAWMVSFLAQANGGIVSADVAASANSKNDSSSEDSSFSSQNGDSSSELDSIASDSTDKKTAKSDNSDFGKIAIIAGAILLGLASVEVFAYRIIKLKKK